MTEAEYRLWYYLRSRRFHRWKFHWQVPIPPYIADFICFEKRLIIEVDGGQHQENQIYDQKRTHFLQEKGLRVIRFWNNEVLSSTEVVLEAIFKALENG